MDYLLIPNAYFLNTDLFRKYGITNQTKLVSEDFIQTNDIKDLIKLGAVEIIPRPSKPDPIETTFTPTSAVIGNRRRKLNRQEGAE